MGKVTAQLSMSINGYIAGPNTAPDNPMGAAVRSCTSGFSG